MGKVMGKPAGGGGRGAPTWTSKKVWVLVFIAPRPQASLSSLPASISGVREGSRRDGGLSPQEQVKD